MTRRLKVEVTFPIATEVMGGKGSKVDGATPTRTALTVPKTDFKPNEVAPSVAISSTMQSYNT